MTHRDLVGREEQTASPWSSILMYREGNGRTYHAYKHKCKRFGSPSSGMKPSVEPSATVSTTKLPEGQSHLPPYTPLESPETGVCKPEDKPEDPESEDPRSYAGTWTNLQTAAA